MSAGGSNVTLTDSVDASPGNETASVQTNGYCSARPLADLVVTSFTAAGP